MVLTFSFFFSFTFDLVSFLSLCPHFFCSLHLLYLLLTLRAPCNNVGGGDTSRTAKWGSFRYASVRQERLGCRNESAEEKQERGIKRHDESAT